MIKGELMQKMMRLEHNKCLSVRSFRSRAADQMLVGVNTSTSQTPSPAPPHQLTLSSWAEGFFMISMGGGSGVCASSSCSSSPPLCIPEGALERRFPSLLRTLWGNKGSRQRERFGLFQLMKRYFLFILNWCLMKSLSSTLTAFPARMQLKEELKKK